MFAPSVSSLAATQATRRFSHYHSSDKTITIEGSERRILLKDVQTALDMTSETPQYKYVNVHSKCAVLVTLRL